MRLVALLLWNCLIDVGSRLLGVHPLVLWGLLVALLIPVGVLYVRGRLPWQSKGS